MNTLPDIFKYALTEISQARKDFAHKLAPKEIGVIKSISTGIATVTGLPDTGLEELLLFPGGLYGIAYNLEEDEIGVVLLGEYVHLQVGDPVERTKRVMDVPVGESFLGRVISPLGKPLDGKPAILNSSRLPIERPATPISDRAPVQTPLQTGIKVIDTLIPVGRGQRELIMGDRQTGKTAIALNAILNQHDQNVICIYCGIGQRASSVSKVIETLKEKKALHYTTVVVTKGNDPPGLIYLAPYAATSMAEYFMEKGKDVLIVYDDLTHHARAYRELSLLLRRPPGREAFPGDIFYIHSRLLERSTHLNKALGGGSLSALPIVETEAENISAYIPTNLISITDGQIYLSPKLFELGILPAVDVGKSVSRVGGKTQRGAYQGLAGSLKLTYIQLEELEVFSRFGTRLDEQTKKSIAHGHRIRACLQQREFETVPLVEQIIVMLALTNKLFDDIPLEKMREAEFRLRKAVKELPDELISLLNSSERLPEEYQEIIVNLAKKKLTVYKEALDNGFY